MSDRVRKWIGRVIEPFEVAVRPAEVVGQLVNDRFADLDAKLFAISEFIFMGTFEDDQAVQQVMGVDHVAAPEAGQSAYPDQATDPPR